MSLPELIQKLPPELRDMIYDLTVTPGGQHCFIDGTYKSPSQLQTNSALRLKFARLYYGDYTTFRSSRSRTAPNVSNPHSTNALKSVEVRPMMQDPLKQVS